MTVLGHFFLSSYFLLWASRGLYVSSFVTRFTLSLFALDVTWPLCFLHVKHWHTKFVSSYGRHVAFMFFVPSSRLPAYYMVSSCPYARVVIPSSRMYLLLSKQERLHFVISQLVII